MSANKRSLILLLGIALITQATTSIVGGLIGFGPFFDTSDTAAAMSNIASNVSTFYVSIFLSVWLELISERGAFRQQLTVTRKLIIIMSCFCFIY